MGVDYGVRGVGGRYVLLNGEPAGVCELPPAVMSAEPEPGVWGRCGMR